MFQDANLTFDQNVAITTTRVSTNVIDLFANRDLGVGRVQAKLVVIVTAAFTSATPTATPSATPTATASFTDSPTATPSSTISQTFTQSPTFSVSPTITQP